MLADIADLGGTDPELLADEEFAELLTTAVRADYQAFNRYDLQSRCPHWCRHPRRSAAATTTGSEPMCCGSWERHTAGTFALSLYDGGHFYVNDHVDAVAAQVNADA